MSTASRIGRSYRTEDFLKSIPDSQILVEAAVRRGQSMTELIEPQSPSLQRIDVGKWKNAWMSAVNVSSPNRVPLMEVYDNIRIDNTLTSMIDTRILKVQLSRFMLIDKAGKPDTEAKKFLEKEWFWDLIEMAMESRFEGFSLIELFDFNPVTSELDRTTRISKYHVNPALGIVSKLPGDDKGYPFIDNPNYIAVGKKDNLGLLYKAAVHILAKKFALSTWAEFNEKIGIPFRTVHTNTTDKTRQQQLAVIMDKMGSAGWAVLNENEKVELLAISGTDPTKCFESLIAKLDSEIAMLILGQSSTSNSQNNKGTYGSMKILQEISEDRHESDKIFLKYLINNVLLPRLIILSPAYKVFSNLYFEWDNTEFLSLKEIVDYIVQLSGVYNIDPEYISLKTGIPITGLKTAAAPDPNTGPVKKKSLTASKINAFYSDKCCTHSSLPVAVSPNGYEADVLRVAKLLFDGKQKGVVDYSLLKKTAAELKDALFTGYTTSTDIKNVEMLKALETNIHVFSGFKTYQQLKEISSKLKDENGNVRTLNDFKAEVLKVNQTYNVRHLATEYDHALVSSQMASQWLDIQANKHILPYLKFDATLDNRTTSVCRGLDGVTLPVDHPFWDMHYLPLHWHERSIIQQVSNGTHTDLSKIALPELQPMFQGNVGKDGVIFPKSHPYYDASKKDIKEIMNTSFKAEVYAKPRKQQFESIFTDKKNNNTLDKHLLASTEEIDFKDVLKFSKALIKQDTSCEMLPRVHQSEKEVRDIIFPNLKSKTANPDIKKGDEYIDVKSVHSIFKIVKRANEASKQGAIACITDTNFTLTDKIIEDKSKDIFNSKDYQFDQIYWFKKGKIIIKNRKGDK